MVGLLGSGQVRQPGQQGQPAGPRALVGLTFLLHVVLGLIVREDAQVGEESLQHRLLHRHGCAQRDRLPHAAAASGFRSQPNEEPHSRRSSRKSSSRDAGKDRREGRGHVRCDGPPRHAALGHRWAHGMPGGAAPLRKALAIRATLQKNRSAQSTGSPLLNCFLWFKSEGRFHAPLFSPLSVQTQGLLGNISLDPKAPLLHDLPCKPWLLQLPIPPDISAAILGILNCSTH